MRRSYTFDGCEGQTVEVHVYADADEVELFQNGVSMGTLPCGEAQEYQAAFSIPYRPGTLEAVARRGGTEAGRDILRTAGETVRLALHADKVVPQDGGEALCFLSIQAVDKDGVPVCNEGGEVTVRLSGGQLLALGNADPKPDRDTLYHGDACPLYEGTALAVIRGSGGCLAEAALGDLSAQLSMDFTSAKAGEQAVHDVHPGPLDLPLGELMENAAAMAVLEKYIAPVVKNPMAGAMAGMSLKKIFGMSGQTAPEGLASSLAAALA